MLTNLSLFSGAGGLDLGARMVGGFKTVAYVEYDRYAQGVLTSRMRDGSLDDAPIFEDVRTFDGRCLRGSIDVVSGGFPCQDVSIAGKRKGLKSETRSGLWSEFSRIICEVKPRFVLVENVRGLLSVDDGRGYGTVLGDLAGLGFDVFWSLLSAADIGAPHRRERVWVIGVGQAHPELRRRLYRQSEIFTTKRRLGSFCQSEPGDKPVGDPLRIRRMRRDALERWGEACEWRGESPKVGSEDGDIFETPSAGSGVGLADSVSARQQGAGCSKEEWRGGVISPIGIWPARPGESQRDWEPSRCIESKLGRNPYGLADRAHRIRCTGNGVVPQQAKMAWRIISEIARIQAVEEPPC